MAEILAISELIDHCNRQLERYPSNSQLYREHEATRYYLQILRHYMKLGTVEELAELVEAKRDGRCVVLPCRCETCRHKDTAFCRASKSIKYDLHREKHTYRTFMEPGGFCSIAEPPAKKPKQR